MMNEIMKEALLSFIKDLKNEVEEVQVLIKETEEELKDIENELSDETFAILRGENYFFSINASVLKSIKNAEAESLRKKEFYTACLKKQKTQKNKLSDKIAKAFTLLSTL